jgi:hypothetical protein
LPNSVMNEEMGANVPESKIEKKALVLIILVIVFKHTIKIKKDMFVYIQQSKLYEHVFSDCSRYWKLHNEYHQHV